MSWAFKYAVKRGILCFFIGTPLLLATTHLSPSIVVVEMVVLSVLITIGIWLDAGLAPHRRARKHRSG